MSGDVHRNITKLNQRETESSVWQAVSRPREQEPDTSGTVFSTRQARTVFFRQPLSRAKKQTDAAERISSTAGHLGSMTDSPAPVCGL